MKNDRPEISVIMSVFNGEKYFSEAIESILNQTFTNFEFLVIDDCSKDDSFNILNTYAEKDSRIRLFRNNKNQGLANSLNILVKKTKGKLVARMDADDISLPDRLEKQYKYCMNDPKLAICGTYIEMFGDIVEMKPRKLPLKHEDIEANLLFECVLNASNYHV